MSIAFSRSLYLSKRLSTYRTLIFQYKKFSTPAAVSNVLEVKEIRREPLLLANLTHCLDDLGEINAFVRELEKSMKTEFIPTEKAHADLLVQFWEGMMPNTRVPSFIGDGSDDWTLVGFQGKKPQTDFRGMGLLGLKQLAWFAKHRGQRARECLKECTVQSRYLPFAATGINITAFLMELLKETRLHVKLIELAERNYVDDAAVNKDGGDGDRDRLLGSSGSSSSGKQEEASTWRQVPSYGCEEELNMIYCDFYSAFVALWVKRDPSSTMEFPSLFAEFKEGIRRSLSFSALA